MTNLEIYDREFIKLFKVKKEDLPTLKYRGIKAWDSVAHMDLMNEFEEIFDIQISTVDMLDFTGYEKGKEVLARYGVEIGETDISI
jgi:acyl carrier protein